jgi:hypothetical protein
MKPPKIVIPIDIVDDEKCLYKLYYGKYYIIVMAKSVYRSVESINADLERYSIGNTKAKDGLYGVFCKHVLSNPKEKFRFERIAVCDSPYELLKLCQIELEKSYGDKLCLNTNKEPYISKRIQTAYKYLTPTAKEKMYWINRGHYLKYISWNSKIG